MRKESGFTLVELVITVAVMAILMAIALPSFQQIVTSSTVVAATNELVADLALARSEATKRGSGAIVTVCASDDGESCSASNDWSSGRLVYVDGNTVGTVDGTDGARILRKTGASSGVDVKANGFSTTGYISYRGDGTLNSALSGTLTVCKSGLHGRVISISNVGRTQLAPTESICS